MPPTPANVASAAPIGSAAAVVPGSAPRRDSTVRSAGQETYSSILKSSALIGGSSVIKIAVQVIRAKALAILLGPAGVGLMGLLYSVSELTRGIAGMGINSSGVRQIAEAAGSEEPSRIARTATVLRRVSLALGLIGAAVLIGFRRQISIATFGSDAYALPVALLSFAVFFQLISDGQAALIQGLRRIGDLARIGVLASGLSALAGVVLVFALGAAGIVPSLIAASAISLAVSWWYRRKVDLEPVAVSGAEMRSEAEALLKLGFAFMASAVLTTGAAYIIRAYLGKHVGLAGAGLYQSAWSLGGLYVGFILQAMGSDFYPRLTAAARNHDECNRLVNEQAQISLLLAGPGMLATLTFAPLVIATFYASTFAGAVEPLRWICLGMALRVLAWPMGYIVLAQGANATFFWTEVAATAVHVGLAVSLSRWFGVSGATMGFFGLYVWHGLLIYAIVRRMTGFRWSVENARIIALFLSSLVLVFAAFFVLPMWVATTLGALTTIASGVYSSRTISRLVPLDRLPLKIASLLRRLRIVSSPIPASAGE